MAGNIDLIAGLTPTPFDGRTCNYRIEGDYAVIESIADYLNRVNINLRLPGVLITILASTSHPDTEYHILESFTEIVKEYDVKQYYFDGGVEDDDFVEFVNNASNVHAQNTDTGTTAYKFTIGSGTIDNALLAEEGRISVINKDGNLINFRADVGTFNSVIIGGSPVASQQFVIDNLQEFHVHNNQSILDLINQNKVNYWDDKEPAITKGSAAQYFKGNMSLGTFPTLLSQFTNDLGNYGGFLTEQYVHPTSHWPSIITQNELNRFVTDAQISVWNAKQPAGDYALSNHNHDLTYEAKNSNIQSHIGSTSNPHGVTKAQVGLTNVTDNAQWYSGSHPTSISGYGILDALVYSNDARLSDSRNANDVYSWAKAAAKPSYTSAEVTEQTNLYYTEVRVAANSAVVANTAKVSFPGFGVTNVLAAYGDHNHSGVYATPSDVSTAISNLIASSPATLDTLNELATALGNDPNFATTIATSIGNREPGISKSVGFLKWSGTAWTWDNSTYLTSQTSHSDVVQDGDFTSQGIMLRGASSGVYSILTDASANWNSAYSWGNHASGGYQAAASAITTSNIGSQSVAYATNANGAVYATSAGSAAYATDANYATTAGNATSFGGQLPAYYQVAGSFAISTHVHGNITNAGYIGTTATLPIITGIGGILQAGSFGTSAGTFCVGNDTRLSDSRTASDVYTWAKASTKPNYAWSEITSKPTTLSTIATNDLGNYGSFSLASELTTHAGLTTTAHGLGGSAFHADSYFLLSGGTAVNSTQWNGLSIAAATYTSGTVTSALVWNSTNSRFEFGTWAQCQSWLGLGSAAYTASTSYAPASGSANYIQNQNASAQTANMWITGNATIGRTFELNHGYNPYIQFNVTDNPQSWQLAGETNSFKLYDITFSTNPLTITRNTGAATFASTVSAPVFTSTIATGTAPFTVASTTMVSNLNADMLDGVHLSGIAQGSGTTNYVPKWTGSVTLGNSVVQDDGTRIYVTGAGNSRAAISGTGLGTASVFDMGGYFTGSSYGIVCQTTAATAVYGEATTGFGGYFTSSSGYALITATGNVGIGTAQPAYSLSVSNGGYNGLEIDPKSASGTQSVILSFNRGTSAYTPISFAASGFNFSSNGIVNVLSTTASTSTSTGALVVTGGVGVGGAGNFGGNISAPNIVLEPASITADSTKGIYWNGANNAYSIYRSGGTWADPNYQQLMIDWPTGIIINGGTLYGLSGVHFTSTIASISTTTGAVKIAGGLGVGGAVHAASYTSGNLYIGGNEIKNTGSTLYIQYSATNTVNFFNGTLTIASTGAIASSSTGTFTGGGFNSLRSKKNILGEYTGNALDEISKFKVQDFYYKNEPTINRTIGFILDEVPESVQPWIWMGKDNDAVNLYSLHALSFKAHQETKTRVEILEDEVKLLKQKVYELGGTC